MCFFLAMLAIKSNAYKTLHHESKKKKEKKTSAKKKSLLSNQYRKTLASTWSLISHIIKLRTNVETSPYIQVEFMLLFIRVGFGTQQEYILGIYE